MDKPWEALASGQCGMLARRQLRALGISRQIISGHVKAGRWLTRSQNVISTFTGNLDHEQRAWLGVLHAGGSALVGGLTAAKLQGLRRWERDDVTILVSAKVILDPLPGFSFVRTRRPLARMRRKDVPLPMARLEPAVLLHAAYHETLRSGVGLLAAAVQQRRASAASLLWWLERMVPLRGLEHFRRALTDISDGAQSTAEIDIGAMCVAFGLPQPIRQRQRRDSRGILRFTDAEWDLPHGHVLVLEVDGAFHMDVEHWQDDIARQRGLSSPTRHVIRCTAFELRTDPSLVAHDLHRFLALAA